MFAYCKAAGTNSVTHDVIAYLMEPLEPQQVVVATLASEELAREYSDCLNETADKRNYNRLIALLTVSGLDAEVVMAIMQELPTSPSDLTGLAGSIGLAAPSTSEPQPTAPYQPASPEQADEQAQARDADDAPHLKVIRIPRSLWLCGIDSFEDCKMSGKNVGRLMLEDGRKCCLGHFASHLGVPDEALVNVPMPSRVEDIVREAIPDFAILIAAVGTRVVDSLLAEQLIKMNDNFRISGAERERLLCELIAPAGYRFEFVD